MDVADHAGDKDDGDGEEEGEGEAEGGICTGGGRALSPDLEVTVPGPQ